MYKNITQKAIRLLVNEVSIYLCLSVYMSVYLSEIIKYCTNGKYGNIMLIYFLAILQQAWPTN